MQNVSTSSLVGSANPGKWTRGGSPTRASPPLTRINSPDHEDCNDRNEDIITMVILNTNITMHYVL